MSAVSLLENPFAILRIGPRASREEASASARELGTAEASEALRALIKPKSRVEAEVAFLPGATTELARCIMDTLRDGGLPPSNSLTAWARANHAAALLAGDPANEARLNGFLAARSKLDEDSLHRAIEADRDAARIPAATAEMVRQAADAHALQQAELAAGCAHRHGVVAGARLLVSAVEGQRAGSALHAAFLRRLVEAWDRQAARELSGLNQEAQGLAEALRTAPDREAAKRLASVIEQWGTLTGPARSLDLAANLNHRASAEAALAWRPVALTLINDHDASEIALPIVEALHRHFADLPDLGSRLKDDLDACRANVEHDRVHSHPALTVLADAIASAERNWLSLVCALDGSAMVAGKGTTVAALVAAFTNATSARLGRAPWTLLRGFTLWLHNEHAQTAAALTLTKVMVARAGETNTFGMAAAELEELRDQLAQDQRTLGRNLALKRLEAAMKAGHTSDAAACATELARLADTEQERRQATALSQRLEQEVRRKGWKPLAWVAVAVAAFIWWAAQTNTPRPTSPPPPSQGWVPTPAPAPSPTAFEQQPLAFAGTTPLSLPELRWCEFQNRRLNAAQAAIRRRQGMGDGPSLVLNAATDEFNRLVRQYNEACAQRRHYERDQRVVEDEAINRATILAEQGERLVFPSGAPSIPAPRPLPAPTPAPTPQPWLAPPATPSGPATIAPSASPAPSPAADRATARAVQERLNQLGFPVGNADGVIGPRSRAALRDFKVSRGLPDTDTIDQATLRALGL